MLLCTISFVYTSAPLMHSVPLCTRSFVYTSAPLMHNVPLCTISFVYTSAPLTHCIICMQRISGTRLINFPRTWGEQRTPNAWSRIQFSLCSCKNRQISVRSERYAKCSQMVQHRFAILSSHMRIWFANRSQAVHKPFCALVYTRLYIFQVYHCVPWGCATVNLTWYTMAQKS